MAKLIIIDGYNVVYNWPELKKLSDQSLEQAREKLIDNLNNYAAFTGNEIRLVFDGHLVKGGKGSRQKIGEIMVIFSKSGETADEVIEKMIGENHKEIYVVTSDETEQWVAFGRGAWRMPPQEFLKEMTAVLEEIRGFSKEPVLSERFLFHRIDSKIREILDRWRRGN